MKILLIAISLLFFHGNLIAQSNPLYSELYDARIITTNGRLDQRVFLFDLSDSAIIITNISTTGSKVLNPDWNQQRAIMIQNTKLIKLRNLGSIRRGFLLGAATGILVPICGALYSIDHEELRPWYSNFYYGIPIVISCTIIGGAIGTKHEHYPIKQDYNNYQKMRPELERFTIANYNTQK